MKREDVKINGDAVLSLSHFHVSRFMTRFIVSLVSVAGIARAEWTQPKDGIFTEQELTSYLDMSKEWIATMKAAGKAVDGSPAGFAALAIYARGDQRFKGSLARHGLDEAEFNWLGSQAWQAWTAIDADAAMQAADADMAAESKKKADQLAADQTKLAVYQKALAEGRRVLTPEERDAAVKQSRSDRESAAEEANQHAEEARSAAAEAAKLDAEAATDEALANSPPPNVSDDDRPAFVEGAKAAAQAARDGAQEDRMKVSDAKQAQSEAQAKADAAMATMRQPEVPQTEQEKSDFRKKNEEMIGQLQQDILITQEAIKQLTMTSDSFRKALTKQRASIPDANFELLKKHLKAFTAVWQIKT